jgi:hypothetical protein
MSDLPDYIPAKAPAQTIVDLSGKLASAQVEQLNKVGGGLSYKARVVIMPANYKATDAEQLHSLAKSIAQEWHVEGNRLLMVIDLSGKKIRTIAGRDLNQSGVSNEFIQRTVLPDYFYPYVKKGDVFQAVSSSLTAIDARVLAFRQSNSSQTGSLQTRPYESIGSTTSGSTADGGVGPVSGLSSPDYSGYYWIGGLVLLATAIYIAVARARKEKNGKLNQALTDRLGTLYKAADELGQASDYLPPQQNKELALKVSAFFEKLQTMDRAKDEIEKLSKAKQWSKANDGLLPALQLSDNLNAEAKLLLEQVNALTGGVALNGSPEEKKIAAQVVKADLDNHKITVNIKPESQPIAYARPSWTYAQEYTPNLYVGGFGGGGGGGIFDALLMLNQLETNSRLDRLDAIESSRINSYDRDNRNPNANNNSGYYASNTDTGGSWDSSNSSNSSSSSDWSSSTDSGGSWDSDSGSSSSDSSDSSSSDSGSDSGGSW